MFENNCICSIFNIKTPIIQGGMIWCAGWELVSEVSNSGGLGILGAGSMYPEILKNQIQKTQNATTKPFAVNLPLLYPDIEKHIEIIISLGVPIVFTSAGNPKVWTKKLKDNGIIVVHVVSSLKFALKAQEAGVDAIVGEGFEAGGHNGREETTTLCLIPLLKKNLSIPIIAAGGIGTGRTMLAAMVLGADAVQMGSRFVMSEESSAHINFKNQILESGEGNTELVLKNVTPVRLLKNSFYQKIKTAELNCESTDSLREILGKGRAKKGMFEGDTVEGELEIGQINILFDEILSVKEIFETIVEEFKQVRLKML